MTITAQGVRAVYLGSGSAGPFTLMDVDSQHILFISNSEIVATRFDVDGDPTPLVLNVDFTLTGAGSPTAGSLTLTTPLAVGEELVIQRVTARTQVLDLIAGGFTSEAILEALYDKLIRIDQEDYDSSIRAVVMPINYVGDQIIFPEPQDGQFIGWDGTELVNLDATGDPGAAATIEVGNVTTLPAGSAATVVNTGNENAAVFDFGIPRGEDGDVIGPVSSTNNNLAAWDGVGGNTLKDSGISISQVLTEAEAALAYQPLDSDLTAIAALTTTSIGRSLLAAATAAALATIIGVGTGDSPQFTAVNVGAATDTTVTRVSAGTIAVEGQNILTAATGQPLDADLTAIAALTTTTAGRSVLTFADPNADRLIAWDDSAGAGGPIALADITTEASPAAGDFFIMYSDTGNLIKVDWGNIPAGGSADFQQFDASGTWTKPGGFSSDARVLIECWAGGGGGGRGHVGQGGSGGGGGAKTYVWKQLSELAASETVTIGAAGANATVNDTRGGAGGNTTFGAHLTAYGGAGGSFRTGTASGGGGGGGGGGALSAGVQQTADVATGAAGGSPLGGAASVDSSFGGGGGSTGLDAGSILAGGSSYYGGGGGGGGSSGTAAGGNGGNSAHGGGGGGGGGVAGDSSAAGAGGTSMNAGAGGAGSLSLTVAATSGTAPGGGGGGSQTGNSGAGAVGRTRVTVFDAA